MRIAVGAAHIGFELKALIIGRGGERNRAG